MGQRVSCAGQQGVRRGTKVDSFPDLVTLPPELAVQVLSHLNATDLCLASCVNEVWSSLANVDLLWKSLCHNRWGKVTAYNTDYPICHSYKHLYMVLDNGTLTFSTNANEGISYLVRANVLENSPQAIAEFINSTQSLDWLSLEAFLREREDVLDCIVALQDYQDVFLPDALRHFFAVIPAPEERGRFLETLVNKFTARYFECNTHLSMTKDCLLVICYSLILLSVDLTSPHVKNKMSKREFIRNLRQATVGVTNDTLGHMYDNIYLSGHVATKYR